MRISTLQIFNIANNSMRDVSESMVKTQEQLSTGKKFSTAADDPIVATRIQQLNDQLSSVTQYENNITIATNNLTVEENALESVTNLVQRMREITVQAGNTAVLSKSDYETLASEVDVRLDELFDLVNTQSASGDYIFSGFKAGQPAFEGDPTSGYRYQGDEGQLNIQVNTTTKISTSDSGKTLFANINTGENTIETSVNPTNRSDPPVTISLGQVIDQAEFDDFYPEDMVITFNADSDISPPGRNFTVTEKSTGKVIEGNHRFIAGEQLEYNGVEVRISGDPVSGISAIDATRNFGADSPVIFPVDFSTANQTVNIRVGSRIETLVLDANITDTSDLATVLNDAANGNAAKLANLGIEVDAAGFSQAQGINFSLVGGDSQVVQVMGLDTLNGSSSIDGERSTKGDQLFVDSTNKQDILTTLARFSQAMKDYDGTDDSIEALETIVGTTLANLSFTESSVSEVVTQIGSRINVLESTEESHQDTRLISQNILSQLQDVDYAEAATRLSTETLILQAAQATFLQVSRLNLFERM